MSRISVPKLEVIRFSTEDVIVTSGTGLRSTALVPDQWYATSGSELIDASITQVRYRAVNEKMRYWFTFNDNSVQNLTTNAVDINTAGTTYAWFYGQWRTGDLPYVYNQPMPDLGSFTEYYSN